MGDVVVLKLITALDIPPERVLNAANEKQFKSIVILGELEDGSEYFCSSVAGGPEVCWMLERAKHKLIKMGDE